MGERIFVSKRDRWGAIMFWSIALLGWGIGLWAVFQEAAFENQLMVAGLGFLGGWSVLWFWFTTRYRITATSLHLHSGCFHSQIPLRKIRAVIASRKGWGMSYALSLETLQIDVAGSRFGYQISPEDRAGFMKLIAERCNLLAEKGEDLFR